MAINERDRDTIRKKFTGDNWVRVYQEFVNYCMGGVTAGIDFSEYRMFVQMTLSKDVTVLAHGYLSGVFTWDEYWDRLQTIVGFDLMIQGVVTGQIKAKSNGENKDELGQPLLTAEELLEGTVALIKLSGDTDNGEISKHTL